MNSKKKGNAGEHAFAKWWMAQGLGKANRNAMSGGSIWKGDIGNANDLCIEVKTVKKLNLMDLWKQVRRDADQCHATPVAAVHFDHMPEDKWLIVLDSADFADMFKKSQSEKQIVEVPQEDSRERRYALEKVKYAVQNALKYL